MADKKIYWVEGKLILEFDLEYEAETEEEAKKLAIEEIKGDYHLDTLGMMHKDNFKIEVDAGEYDEE